MNLEAKLEEIAEMLDDFSPVTREDARQKEDALKRAIAEAEACLEKELLVIEEV